MIAVSAWPEAAQSWASLVCQAPRASFFLTPEWVETWLEVYGPRLRTEVLLFRDNAEVIGACLLATQTVRKGPLWLRRIYAHTAGEDEADGVCAEYTDVLAKPGKEAEVVSDLTAHLRSRNWDELYLTGFSSESALAALESRLRPFPAARRTSPCYYVDLAALRDQNVSYIESLRQPTRKHVKQYLRYASAAGQIAVRAARETGEALEFLEQLRVLHQARWNAKGLPGAFASARFLRFHQALIRRAFPGGGVQLLRIQAGERTVGILYNFVFRSKVYFYQSGFDYSLDPRVSPGIVTNACAIQYCLEQGLSEYDFLAGEAQYKRVLASGSRDLGWIVMQRPGWRTGSLEMLRKIKRKVHGQPTPENPPQA